MPRIVGRAIHDCVVQPDALLHGVPGCDSVLPGRAEWLRTYELRKATGDRHGD